MGGSPCTHWSIAQTKNRETEPSGLGWELFENYVIGLKKYKPDYFLYENNKSMSPAIREQITKELGVEPILINSALVSAQNRNRLYWTNIPGVTQPEDRGILLKDVLETYCSERGYSLAEPIKCLSEKEMDYMVREIADGRNHFDFGYIQDATRDKGKCITANISKGIPYNVCCEPIRIGTIANNNGTTNDICQSSRVYSPYGKSVTLRAQGGGGGAKTGLYAVPMCLAERGRYKDGKVQQNYEPQYSGKTNTLTTVQKDNLIIEFWDGKTYPVYEVSNGQIAINGKQYPIKLPNGYYIIRKLTVKECMRLQTVPDAYTFPVSNTQAYKMLGNGWTADVIAHILSFISGITEEKVNVMSMYDGMSCGHIALDKLGANVGKYYATEIDKYAIQTAHENYPEMIHLGDAYQVRNEDWNIN